MHSSTFHITGEGAMLNRYPKTGPRRTVGRIGSPSAILLLVVTVALPPRGAPAADQIPSGQPGAGPAVRVLPHEPFQINPADGTVSGTLRLVAANASREAFQVSLRIGRFID